MKKISFAAMILILSLSTAVGIFVTIMAANGNWNDTSFRMLLTTLILDACALCFLSCYTYLRRGGIKAVAIPGIAAALYPA